MKRKEIWESIDVIDRQKQHAVQFICPLNTSTAQPGRDRGSDHIVANATTVVFSSR